MRLYAEIATCWSVSVASQLGFMTGRSFVSFDMMVTVPRDVGAMRQAMMPAYWLPSLGCCLNGSEKLPTYAAAERY